MKKTHPAFWAAGWVGMLAGAALVAIGTGGSGEVGSLAGGYGLMLMGSAVYLLAGLRLRERRASRSGAVAMTAPAKTSSAGPITVARSS